MSYKFSLKRRYPPEQSTKDKLLVSDNIQIHYVPSFTTFQSVILSLLLVAYVLTTNPIFVVTDDSLRNYQHMILISLKQQKIQSSSQPTIAKDAFKNMVRYVFCFIHFRTCSNSEKDKFIKLKKGLKYTKLLIKVNQY